MDRRPWYRLALAVSLAWELLTTSPAHAERLLAPSLLPNPRSARGVAGIGRVQPLALGRAALADLRARRDAVIAQFPLGADGAVDLELTRFEPFTADVRVEIVEGGRARTLSLPDRAYFSGTVRGKPGSRALVIAAPDSVHGFVTVDDEVYSFAPDGAGGHRAYALRDVDPAAYPPPGDFCANDLRPDAVRMARDGAGGRRSAAPAPAMSPRAAAGTLKEATIAIDTDHELRAKFDSDEAALDYLASLVAAASAIYERDLSIRLRASYVRLWGDSADPWTKSDTVDALYEVMQWWDTIGNGMSSLPRGAVHFISGKSVHGGVAFLGVLCNTYWAYGVSQVYGSFDLSNPNQIWDLLVVAHELGHTFGSTHTHCYDPPLDHCFNAEDGCYAGVVEPSRGTIMSYCHLNGGGLANIDLFFGSTVSATIGAFTAGVACLAEPAEPQCGNGAVEIGEECDDGNTTDGDCCSATCQLEANGSACDDGDGCTRDDTCSAGACAGTTFASCGPCLTCASDGSCVVPSQASCAPASSRRSRVSLTTGANAEKSRLTWRWRGAGAVAKASFGAPTASSDVALCVYDQSNGAPQLRLAASAPAGDDCNVAPCWKETRTGFTYLDRALDPSGILRVQLRSGAAGRATIALSGKGANLTLPALPLVPPVSVRLERRDATACWVATYDTPARNDAGGFRATSP